MNEDQIMRDMDREFDSAFKSYPVNEKQIMEDMNASFISMMDSCECMMVVRQNGRIINVIVDPPDDYRRWIPDRIVDPSELVHQIEVR